MKWENSRRRGRIIRLLRQFFQFLVYPPSFWAPSTWRGLQWGGGNYASSGQSCRHFEQTASWESNLNWRWWSDFTMLDTSGWSSRKWSERKASERSWIQNPCLSQRISRDGVVILFLSNLTLRGIHFWEQKATRTLTARNLIISE